MTRYWLTPIVSYSPLTLGAARMDIPAASDFEAFRQMAAHQHPRLLPMFKASLLLSDDEDVCGSELVELDLTLEEDLVFNGEPLHLSHCAEAFLDRLLTNQEAGLLLSVMEEEAGSLEGPPKGWLKQWREWLEAGYDIVLLREDGC
ncbi:hypothetical protein A8709_24380 [Paenibacillus pectinilyticus]|uniref:Uncharacterized protein n=1 Tax=Paenibacillus pectinilyticus TaxID=512399 RepID=A0A1C1A938_9BACL|nr:hypothetical protein [Paenibacillus pectinilyticus]OCT17125.1 hypothetical protein A8709_24380 [Paenibacillus pectinilyticus]